MVHNTKNGGEDWYQEAQRNKFVDMCEAMIL